MSTPSASFWRIARQPRWIAALLAVLVVAAVFAALGRWQLERSVAASVVNEIDTETPVALLELAEPQSPVTGEQLGRVVTVSATPVVADGLVLRQRLHEGAEGYWAVGRVLVQGADSQEPPVSLVVAYGWAPSEAEARAGLPTVAEVLELAGRYLPPEPPREEDLEHELRSAVSVADFINLWPEFDGLVYAGYLIVDSAPPGLVTIEAPPPLPEASVNWLNVFYAIEWIIFAGFALYLWYRLVRDEVEREVERELESEGSTAPTVD